MQNSVAVGRSLLQVCHAEGLLIRGFARHGTARRGTAQRGGARSRLECLVPRQRREIRLLRLDEPVLQMPTLRNVFVRADDLHDLRVGEPVVGVGQQQTDVAQLETDGGAFGVDIRQHWGRAAVAAHGEHHLDVGVEPPETPVAETHETALQVVGLELAGLHAPDLTAHVLVGLQHSHCLAEHVFRQDRDVAHYVNARGAQEGCERDTAEETEVDPVPRVERHDESREIVRNHGCAAD